MLLSGVHGRKREREKLRLLSQPHLIKQEFDNRLYNRLTRKAQAKEANDKTA